MNKQLKKKTLKEEALPVLDKVGVILDAYSSGIIEIEGHTDNVPFSGNGNVLDNWDLSVKRATSIVRILLENSDINPAKVSASGRSEYCPIDTADTKEARKANRRIEIILTPDLDELLKIFE